MSTRAGVIVIIILLLFIISHYHQFGIPDVRSNLRCSNEHKVCMYW